MADFTLLLKTSTSNQTVLSNLAQKKQKLFSIQEVSGRAAFWVPYYLICF